MLSLSNEWGLIIESPNNRPDTSYGTSITPGNNTYGSYVEIVSGATLTDDAYEIEIFVHGIGSSAKASDSLTTIGIDPAGGTSWTDTISHLLTSYASIIGSTGGGVSFRFPLFIKAGSSIAAKGSINNATVGTQLVAIRCYCKPSRPELVRRGAFVRTFGAVTASSRGTAVTFGTASEGSYTQLGAAITDTELWYWHVASAPLNSSATNAGGATTDLAVGDASNKKVLLLNELDSHLANESRSSQYRGGYSRGASGDLVYARGQSGSAITDFSAIAYGVG